MTNKPIPIGPRLVYNFFALSNKSKIYEAEVNNKRNPKPRTLLNLVRRAYNKLTDEEKEVYKELARKDKERYERQMKEYNEKGYFTLEDGRTSTLIKHPPSEQAKKRKPTPIRYMPTKRIVPFKAYLS